MESEPLREKLPKDLPPYAMISILLAAIALIISVGAGFLAWVTFSEQLQIRRDFTKLQNDQKQTTMQYEYWLNQVRTLQKAPTK